MTTPISKPAEVTADPLARELAAQGHRVVFIGDGGEPSLMFVDGQLRGYAHTTKDGAVELRFAETTERRPFVAEGLEVAGGVPVRIVPVFVRGDRAWFVVIEMQPAGDDASVGPPPWRVRLIERSGGRSKLLGSHDSYAHTARNQVRSVYERQGEVVVLDYGGSLYAVAGGRVLVLDGPGADASRFHERGDPDCPPNKRCFPLPAEIDVKRYIGHAPSGRSFVMAGEGYVLRREVASGAQRVFGYNNFFYTGLVEEDAVVLAHAGEPPFVKRWTPAGPRAPGPSLPRIPGTRDAVDMQTGDAQLLVEGPIYEHLARSTDGALYGVTREGSLDRIHEGRATPVVKLPVGHKVVAVAAGDALAFVVASDATPPVHAIVIAGR